MVCGPSLAWRSGSSAGEPIVKLPPEIKTMSSPAPAPSPSVKSLTVYFSGGFRTPCVSTVAVSKAVVRNDGFDSNLRTDGAATAAPVPTVASAAIPNACPRVRFIGCLRARRRGSAGRAVVAIDAWDAAAREADCLTSPSSLETSRSSRLIISRMSDSHRV